MRNNSAVAPAPAQDGTAQETLRDLIDGKLRGAPTDPEPVGNIIARVMPILAAAVLEHDQSA